MLADDLAKVVADPGPAVVPVAKMRDLKTMKNVIEQLESAERTVYFAALLNGDADNFFGPVLSTSPVTNSFTITNLDTTATSSAQLKVALQGVSNGPHVVGVQLNAYPAGTVKFINQNAGVATLAVPITALHQGSNNVLTLTVEGGQHCAARP